MTEDPGLQPQRTALAWRRTTLTAATVAFLITRSAAATGGHGLLLPAGAAVVTASLLWTTARYRQRRIASGIGSGHTVAAPGSLLLMTVATVGSAVAALAVQAP